MDKLAELAQVSKRTVYNHFATKEELVMFLLTDLWNSALVNVEPQYNAEIALENQISALLRDEIELVSSKDYIELSSVAFGHFFYHPEALKKEVEKFAPQETALFKWLEAASEDKRLVEFDIGFGFEQLHNLIKGSCFWPQIMKFEETLDKAAKDRLAEHSAKMFLGMYEKRV